MDKYYVALEMVKELEKEVFLYKLRTKELEARVYLLEELLDEYW